MTKITKKTTRAKKNDRKQQHENDDRKITPSPNIPYQQVAHEAVGWHLVFSFCLTREIIHKTPSFRAKHKKYG